MIMDFRSLAKMISKIENGQVGFEKDLKRLYKENSKTSVIGVTGPPGAGKSSLVDKIINEYRCLNKSVAVVAVDPSSPFSGGAILGDRIRMGDHFSDSGVFIRSMGSRGSLGGLAPAAIDVINLMKSAGFDVLIVETVGVGQSEIEIMTVADSVLLVLVPGLGDDIQALKAGIMEIADIFVINKADKEGKERLAAEINMIIQLNREKFDWLPPIVETVATEGGGISSLMDQINARTNWLEENGGVLKKEKIVNQFKQMAMNRVGADVLKILDENHLFEVWKEEVSKGKSNPYSAIEKLSENLKISWNDNKK